MYQLRVPLE
jgi:hypothetical protein